jgi:hypothetical protein
MGFTLRIEIDGLCAFVPNRTGNRMRVLLLNGLVPAAVHGGVHVPYHFPGLRVSGDDFDEDCSAPPDLQLQDGSKVFLIAWEDIEVLPQPHWPHCHLHIQNGRRPGSAEPNTHEEEKDFSWIVEVAQLVPGAESEPSLLQPSPPRNLLMGRLALDRGTIGTKKVVKGAGGRNVIFEFACSKSSQPLPLAQAMASKVLYTLEVPYDCLDLGLTRFGERELQQQRTVRLRPGTSDTVTVKLRNVPLEELIGLPPVYSSSLDHFGLLYRTLKTIPDDPPIPRPLYQPYVVGGPAQGATTICTGHALPPV